MPPKTDLHIHTNISACANRAMELTAIVRECERLGVQCIGVTDHLNQLEHVAWNTAILPEIRRLETDVAVYFAAEVNYSRKAQGHPLTAALKEEYGFQYAIGTHHSTYLKRYNLKKLIETQHRHHLRTCEDPAMDILGHPYRFLKGEFDTRGWPWLDSVRVVPEKFIRELGRTARETGTAVEINATSNLVNKFNPPSYFEEYVDFLRVLAEEGATFATGSDAHELDELETIRLTWEVVERLGLSDDRIWRPQCEPASAARGQAL